MIMKEKHYTRTQGIKYSLMFMEMGAKPTSISWQNDSYREVKKSGAIGVRNTEEEA